MLFGNWIITDEGITWNGTGLNRFVIPKESLNTIRRNENDEAVFYHWILLAIEEDWLTQNDIYDLNFAFVYAIAKFGLEFNYDVFDSTLAEQYDLFDAEDEEDADI